jgi:hypothetical protein
MLQQLTVQTKLRSRKCLLTPLRVRSLRGQTPDKFCQDIVSYGRSHPSERHCKLEHLSGPLRSAEQPWLKHVCMRGLLAFTNRPMAARSTCLANGHPGTQVHYLLMPAVLFGSLTSTHFVLNMDVSTDHALEGVTITLPFAKSRTRRARRVAPSWVPGRIETCQTECDSLSELAAPSPPQLSGKSFSPLLHESVAQRNQNMCETRSPGLAT